MRLGLGESTDRSYLQHGLRRENGVPGAQAVSHLFNIASTNTNALSLFTTRIFTGEEDRTFDTLACPTCRTDIGSGDRGGGLVDDRFGLKVENLSVSLVYQENSVVKFEVFANEILLV